MLKLVKNNDPDLNNDEFTNVISLQKYTSTFCNFEFYDEYILLLSIK